MFQQMHQTFKKLEDFGNYYFIQHFNSMWLDNIKDSFFFPKDKENPLPPSDEEERKLQRRYNKSCQDLRVKVEGKTKNESRR